ncbi:unnamed protein product, partial [marine sediment metagenome]
NQKSNRMITLIAYLTRPELPKEYDSRIYKFLFRVAVTEGLLYITILLSCLTLTLK